MFWNFLIPSGVLVNHFKEIAFLCVLHDDVETGSLMIIKCLFEFDNILVLL
jgi:hypothetical protein